MYYIHTYSHVHICALTEYTTYIYMHMHVYVSMHTYRTYVSMYTLMCFIYKCVYTYINTHGYIIYIHVHVHTYEQCVLGSPRCMSEFILSVVSKGSQALSLYLGHHPWSL